MRRDHRAGAGDTTTGHGESDNDRSDFGEEEIYHWGCEVRGCRCKRIRARLVGCMPLGSHRPSFFRPVWLPGRRHVLTGTGSQSTLEPGPGGTPGSAVSSESLPFPQKWRTRLPHRATAGDGWSSRGTAKSRRHEFGHRA